MSDRGTLSFAIPNSACCSRPPITGWGYFGTAIKMRIVPTTPKDRRGIQLSGNDDTKPDLEPKDHPKPSVVITLAITMILQFAQDELFIQITPRMFRNDMNVSLAATVNRRKPLLTPATSTPCSPAPSVRLPS
jgi:hypothetical protein